VLLLQVQSTQCVADECSWCFTNVVSMRGHCYLLENPFLAMEADDPPAAESSSATAATADPVAAATDGGADEDSIPMVVVESGAGGDAAADPPSGGASSSSAGSGAVGEGGGGGGTSDSLDVPGSSAPQTSPKPAVASGRQLFPVFAVKSDSELHIDKDFIVHFPACLCDYCLHCSCN